MAVYYYTTQYDDYLMHHGIKNQKWGIRRFQNEDGTLTPAGIKRYRGVNEKKSLKRQLNDLDKDRARSLADHMVANRKATKKENRVERLRNKGVLEESSRMTRAKAKSSEMRNISDRNLKRMRDDESRIDETVKKAVNDGYLVTGNDTIRERKRDVVSAVAAGQLFGVAGAAAGRTINRAVNYAKYGKDYGYDFNVNKNGRTVTKTFRQTPDMVAGRSYKVDKLSDGEKGEYIQNRTFGEGIIARKKRKESGSKSSSYVKGLR